MHLIDQFIAYLINQSAPASHVTIKNYRADVKQFIVWFEKEFNKIFIPQQITLQIIDLYKKSKTQQQTDGSLPLSERTLERHVSSLRKFFSFLKQEDFIQINPFEVPIEKREPFADWRLKEFKQNLYNNKSSYLTIKNYILDIQQFLSWVEKVTIPNTKWNYNQTPVLHRLTSTIIQEYKNRLFETAGFSPASINRKLSAIRKFIHWSKQQGYITESTTIETPPNIPPQFVEYLPEERTIPKQSAYSRFPPFRLVQKINRGTNTLLDLAIITPVARVLESFLYAAQNKKNQRRPLLFQKTYTQIPSQSNLWRKIRNQRPITGYFHLLILVVCIDAVAFGFYTNFFTLPKKNSQLLAASTAPPRVLSFQGRLTDPVNSPITTSKLMRFSIYNSPTASGASGLLWQETNQVTPDSDGIFNTLLGKNTAIPQSLFAENATLYLGITIGQDSELVPRQQLATVGYATNAEVLQGLPPITQGNAGQKNVILALDSSGNLTIGGVASPVFQATGGTFKLSGQQLTLTTNTGSGGDIQIAPDGNGKVDIEKGIVNNSSNGIIVPGAVEVLDRFVVFATEAAQAAFIVNNDSTKGGIFTASSSGITRFVIDNGGNVGIGGITSPQSALQVAGSITPASDGDASIGKSDLAWGTVFAKNISLPASGGKGGYWQLSSGILSPTNITNDFALGGNSTSAAKFKVVSSNGNLTTAGSVTLSSLTAGVLQTNSSGVVSNVLGTVNYIPTWSSSGLATTSNLFDNGTNVGIGDITPTEAKLVVGDAGAGDIYATFASSSNTERLCWDGSGASLITDCSGTPGDYAEQYGTFDKSIEAGDVVAIDASRSATLYEKGGEQSSKAWIVKATKPYDTSVIGIISTHPNEVIGKVFEKSENPRPVALNGRVPIKVSLENGAIHTGDYLTSSSVPGIAMKATLAGMVVGKALQDYDRERITNNQTGKIIALVHTSWYNPDVYVTDGGDLSVQNVPNLANSSNFPNFPNGIHRLGAFVDLVAANLTAGLIEAKKVTSDTVNAAAAQIDQITSNKIISPVIEANLVKTDFITPLSSDSILLNGKIVIAKKSPVIASDSEAISDNVVLEVQGSASISGQLTANKVSSEQLAVSGSATISGTLHADTIIANNIEGLNARVATIAAQQFRGWSQESGIMNYKQNPDSLFMLQDSSISAQLNNLSANFGKFELGLVALGGTSLNDVSVANHLTIGQSFQLADNGINVLGSDLELQPLKQGGISFISGLVRIDNEGNLTTNKDIYAKGTLFTNIISPLPDKDVVIKLENVISNGSERSPEGDLLSSTRNDRKFVIQDSSGSAVLTIDNKGKLISSGSGSFKDVLSKTFNIVRQAQADTSITETVASSSAGVATIIQGETERTIINPYVKETSLIYLTPTSDTQGVTPYIARQISDDPETSIRGSFTIQIPQAVYKDIRLNWWIVN